MHKIIKERRQALNFTQEQVAKYLGVTTPAVNKWEKGISYPDISLLPALARLLDTDLNTLLSFNSREKLPVTKSADSEICENQNVCIINQLSEDPDQDYLKPLFKDIAQSFRSQNFQVTEIQGAEFDFNFIQKELTKYGIIFLVTHGIYDETNGMHYLMTGVKHGSFELFLTNGKSFIFYFGDITYPVE